jgi:serine/threonine protein kinase
MCARCLLGDTTGTPFDLLEQIGRGGMGTVWRARHRALDRVVAVKYLSEALASRPAFVARFAHEARVMARLQHPRIVQVHDVGEDEGLPYLVMEYVAGPALAAVLPLTPERAVDIGIGVCEALAYAHRHGVVHRDIKPENILVDDAGGVKVVDFGIACLLDAEGAPGMTATGAIVGTQPCLSPEALAGAAPDPADGRVRGGGGPLPVRHRRAPRGGARLRGPRARPHRAPRARADAALHAAGSGAQPRRSVLRRRHRHSPALSRARAAQNVREHLAC